MTLDPVPSVLRKSDKTGMFDVQRDTAMSVTETRDTPQGKHEYTHEERLRPGGSMPIRIRIEAHPVWMADQEPI